MAISDSIQTLSAAFSFGILLQAATGALFVYWRGHGTSIFLDGRRLVLVLFILFAALWAQIDFLNLLLPTTSTTTCQGTLIISTAFDQLARVMIEQFLLWSVGHGTKLTAERLILQLVLLVRLVAGAALVGFTRPQFAPLCLAKTSMLPIGIVVLALDAVIIAVLLVRALSLGMFRGKGSSQNPEQSKALVLTIAGLTLWTATSVPMILGIPTIILILRTVLPTNGLLILILVVTGFVGPLLLSREESTTTPEATSPFIAPSGPRQDVFNNEVTTDGSPIVYSKGSNLFVVNPSNSPTTFPGNNSRRNSRGFTKLNEEFSVSSREINMNSSPPRPFRPEVKNIPGYRGSSGVFATPQQTDSIQGALAPQIRPTISVKTTDISGPMSITTPQTAKRSLFNFGSKTPTKPSIRTLGISQPVVQQSGSQSGLPRIQTIDLATAANNERERREGAALKAKMIAARPPPPPPAWSSQEALRRSISVKRKEPPKRSTSMDVERMPTLAGSVSSPKNSLDVGNGSTTSASLSPGRDEVRRRSPRNQAETYQEIIDEKQQMRSATMPMPPPPLQRQNTIGLPSNPRSRMTTVGAGPTVMLMNNITYNDPGMVKTIIRDAPNMYTKRPKTAEKSSFSSTTSTSTANTETSLKSSGSIIHRPRPYKRDPEKERANYYPSEPSPGTKRPKSSGSIISRKSMLMSNPGSPTALPPLPMPPRSAKQLKRLLPNDTKSMTFDEKIQLLFPAPPTTSSTKIGSRNRRSSVPSLPRVPSVFIADTPQAGSPTEDSSRRQSKRTTIASFGLEDLQILELETGEGNGAGMKRQEERETYRFSANTYRTLAETDVGEKWLPAAPNPPPAFSTKSRSEVKSQASSSSDLLFVPERQPILADLRKSNMSNSSNGEGTISSHDSSSFWGSIHSEIPPVDLSKVMRSAQSTYIERSGTIRKDSNTFTEENQEVPQIEVEAEGGEIMTVMLDSAENRRSLILDSDHVNVNRRSFFLEADENLSEEKVAEQKPKMGTWHRRIGDELPTFSERPTVRSRKMPPPTPLLLNRGGRQATVLVRRAEPSPPADSPERALLEIQAQLKRFEEPSRGSVGSLLRNLPDASTKSEDNNRLRLLENLEAEMGQQENNWQQMQRNLDRDSMSVAETPRQPETPPESDLSRESSTRSSRPASARGVSRRARIRSSMTVSKGEDTSRTSSSQSSENSRASVWQQRLADAQMVYMENAPDLLRKRSLNFLSVSKAHLSPTPPESVDSASESEVETDFDSENEGMEQFEMVQPKTDKVLPGLWQAPMDSSKVGAGRMWNAPLNPTVAIASAEPPARNVRPAQRYIKTALPISTSNLWTKPASAQHSRPVVGLWGSKLVRPVSIVTRRATQRPLRKSKRVTFLPDIVESPLPVPNKRDTLGIFQFPWGETSDQPVYHPVFDPALLAGPALNARLDARARELESAEYSSSFFDDYEDEDEDDEAADSDDDFDETTLWEIASLLNTSDIPSKNSLLPPPREIIEDYDLSDSDEEVKVEAPMTKLPIQPLSMPVREQSDMWSREVSFSQAKPSAGLPQPEASVWESLIPSSDDVVRSKARTSASIPVLETGDLWTAPAPEVMKSENSPMWSDKEVAEVRSVAVVTPILTASTFMWTAPAPKLVRSDYGLFSKASEVVIRTTEASPAALAMTKTPRSLHPSVPAISSTNLWAVNSTPKETKTWITESAVKKQSVANSALMWTPVSKISDAAVTGLFNLSVARAAFRSSNMDPAAINTIRKPRTSYAPLSQLTSTKLWNGCEKQATEHHWISESSIRPESPSAYSVTSSGNTSPSSDSSSIKSTSTKASSIWSSNGAVTLKGVPSWIGFKRSNKEKKPSSPVNEDAPRSKIPVRPKTPSGLPSVRESRILASRDLWEAKAPVLESPASNPWKKLRRVTSTPKATPKQMAQQRAIRKQARQIFEFPADWEMALAEAVKKSLPRVQRIDATPEMWQSALGEAMKQSKPRVQRMETTPQMWEAALVEAATRSILRIERINATPAMWQSGLAEAITRSLPRVERINASPEMWQSALIEAMPKSVVVVPAQISKYDASVLHPVFFTENLVSTSNDVHPAAIGHVTKTERYNPAVLHPVFFTESLKSTGSDIHPAAIGHVEVQVVAKAQKYDSAVLHPVFFTEKLVSSANDIHPAAFGHVTSAQTVANTQVYDPAVLHPVFFTEKLVSAGNDIHPAAIGHVANKAAAGMWTFPSAASTPKQNSLWSKTSVAPNPCSSSLAPAAEMLRKKLITINLDLPQLVSTNFWEPSPAKIESRNWLMSMKPQSDMWRATSVHSSAKSGALWTKDAVVSRRSTSMLELIGEPIRKAPAARSLEVPALESKKFWEPTQTVSVERNWIEAGKVSSAQTWTPQQSTLVQNNNDASMWTAVKTSAPASPDLFANIKSDHAKQAVRVEPLPQLVSSKLFEKSAGSSQAVNWLVRSSLATPAAPIAPVQPIAPATTTAPIVSVASPAGTWTPRSSSPIQASKGASMWSAVKTSSPTSPDLFANMKSAHVKQAVIRAESLSQLVSTKLFEKAASSNQAVNWLERSSVAPLAAPIVPVAATPRAAPSQSPIIITWTAPSQLPTPTASGNMWEARSQKLETPSTLFSNPHTEPWSRKKRTDVEEAAIQSAELWRRSMNMPESPKNWLEKKRVSRVEFRY